MVTEEAELEAEPESVTLTWDKGGDNDLFVVDPDGEETTYRRSTSAGKIVLDDVDTLGPETFKATEDATGRSRSNSVASTGASDPR